MQRLLGKNVVITGGSSGIGLAAAKLMRSEGARVAVTGRSAMALEMARRELGEDTLVLSSDTANLADIHALAATIQSTFGSIDVLVINAGVSQFCPLDEVTEARYDEIMAVNAKGAFFTVQALAPLLRKGGSIVLNTSVCDEMGGDSTTVFSASKAALRSLARTLSSELLPRGIRVNAVSPGPIRTPVFGKLGVTPEVQAQFEAELVESNPMKRFGQPEEVARAMLFLAADATYTTGAEIPVDGGLTQL